MEYKVIKSRRRTISLEIREGQLVVRTPLFFPAFAVNKFIKDKSDWIDKHLSRTAKATPLSKGKIMILGRPIDLIFRNGQDAVVLSADQIIVSTVDNSKKLQNLKLKHFLIKETSEKVKLYLAKYQDDFVVNFIFTTKMYKSKWGSCSAENALTFNGKLIMTSDAVIEYVVVHELCHTLVKNHSRRFWLEVAKVLPDYKQRRKWLRDNHHLLDYENR